MATKKSSKRAALRRAMNEAVAGVKVDPRVVAIVEKMVGLPSSGVYVSEVGAGKLDRAPGFYVFDGGYIVDGPFASRADAQRRLEAYLTGEAS